MIRADGLVRALRRRDLIALLLHAMMGAGMLVAPSRVFGYVSDWSFVALGASALILTPLIFCFADLSSRFSGTGGPYLYARAALPAWLAFVVGWLLWISQGLGIATLSNLLMSYLVGLAPGLAEPAARATVILGVGAALTGIALVGIRQSAGASNALIVLKLGFVATFLVVGATHLRLENVAVASPPPSVAPFAQAILIFLFGYSGFERGAVVAGEARDPQRDAPAAMFAGVVIASLAYAAILLICMGVLGDPSTTDRPLAEVGRVLFGDLGGLLVSIGAVAVILGTLLSLLVTMPRVLLAMAENGQIPPMIARIHPRWQTPHWAILASAALGFCAALSGDLIGNLTFSTAARLSVYLICCVALWQLAGRTDAPAPRFRLPAARWVASLTVVVFCAVLGVGATKELPTLAGVVALGLAILAFTRRRTTPAPGPQNTA